MAAGTMPDPPKISCTACGACSAVCPTDALHMRRPSDEDYEAGLAEAKTSGELVFSCGYAAKKPGIRVNCVAPGCIETDMVRVLGDETRAMLVDQTPIGRLGTPEDIANVVSFLASDRASFLTGQVVTADGGFIV